MKMILLKLIVFICIVFIGCTPKYNSEKDFILDDKYWDYKINEYIGTTTDVKIPPLINKRPITKISDDAFKNKQLTSVIIPEGITSIGENAFSNNQLSSILIPSSLIYIGKEAFINNQFSKIRINSNLKMNYYTPVFTKEFDFYYLSNGARAGTYILSGEKWNLEKDEIFVYNADGKNPYLNKSSQKYNELQYILDKKYSKNEGNYSYIDNAKEYYLMSLEYHKNDDHEKAIDNLIIANRVHLFGITYYQLGMCLLDIGDFENAEISFNKALDTMVYDRQMEDQYTFDNNGMERENYFALYNIACIKAKKGDIKDSFEYLCRAIFRGYPYIDHIKNDPYLKNLLEHDNGTYSKQIEDIFAQGSNNDVAGKAFKLNWGGAGQEYHFLDENKINIFNGSVWPDPAGWISGNYKIKNNLIMVSNIEYHYNEDEKFIEEKIILYIKDFTNLSEHSSYIEIPLETKMD